jgi:hypothetical protein
VGSIDVVEFEALLRLVFDENHRLVISSSTQGVDESDLDDEAARFGLYMALCGGVLDLLRRPLDAMTWRGVVSRYVKARDEPEALGEVRAFDKWQFDEMSVSDPDSEPRGRPSIVLAARGHVPGLLDFRPRTEDWHYEADASDSDLRPRTSAPTPDECVLVGAVSALIAVYQMLEQREDVLELGHLMGIFLLQVGRESWARASKSDVEEMALSLVARQLFDYDPFEAG